MHQEVAPLLGSVIPMIGEAGATLGSVLGAGALKWGMIQGSRMCAAVQFDAENLAARALVSPEELTAAMTEKLIEEGPDE